jgi:hypothetical protein
MRWSLLSLLVLSAHAISEAQCPVEPRLASLDANATLTVRYYNNSARAVRDVHFVLIDRDTPPTAQPVITNLSARGILPPKQERTIAFSNVGSLAERGSLDLEVLHVSFREDPSWKAAPENPCRISLTRP